MKLKKYYNPTRDLKDGRVGRKIPWGAILTAESFPAIAAELREGEHLYGWLDPVIGNVRAPLLASEARYKAFFGQFKDCTYPTFDFYAVPTADAME